MSAYSRLEETRVEDGSYFDDVHMLNLSRFHFLGSLTKELSAPVMPGSEEREYLSTQVVAEYLAAQSFLNLDGLIFNSSQIDKIKTTNSIDSGKNVVLFYSASKICDSNYPEGKEIDVSLGWGGPDDIDSRITVIEKTVVGDVSEGKTSKSVGNDFFDFFDFIELNGYDIISEVESTLKLDMESIEVVDIKGVVYDVDSRSYSRHRHESSNSDRF